MEPINRNFIDILAIFFSEKKLILFTTFLITLLSIFLSFFFPTIYSSSALLAPTQSKGMIDETLGSYSALSFAGIDLPSSSSSSLIPEAVATINSYKFFKENFLNQINLYDLMAVKSWNSYENIIIYDENDYNAEKKIWVREYTHPFKQIPSSAESYEIFHKNHFKIIEDMDTGFYKITIKHKSPYLAKKWLEIIIDEINKKFRQDQKKTSQASLNYLNLQISKTSFSEIKEVLSILIKKEIETLTLVESNEDYIFKAIDPPSLDEFPDSPIRTFFIIAGFLLGFFISIMIALIRMVLFQKN